MKELINYAYKELLKVAFTIHPSISKFLLYPTIHYFVAIREPWWIKFPIDAVMLGKLPVYHHVEILQEIGVHTIINLVEPYENIVSSAQWEEAKIEVVHLPTPDCHAVNQDNIMIAIQKIIKCVENDGVAYIHCHHGKGRSVSVLACYLVYCHNFGTLNEVLEYMKNHSLSHRMNEEQILSVQTYISNRNQ